jgi:multiple sugar transport system substrate-binding protein
MLGIAGLLAAILVAACSSASNTAGAAVGYGKDKPAVTIQFWYMPNGADPDAYFKAEADAFHAAHPNITVVGTNVSWGDALTKITAALTSGVGPDVTQVGTTWVGGFSQGGGLHQFTPDEIDGLGGKDAFVSAAWGSSGVTGSGQVTAIPWFIDTRAVYYRADVLKDLGIDPTTAFKDWDSFDATLAKIKASGKIAPLGVPGKNDWNVIHNFAPWIWEDGGDYLSRDGSKPMVNDDSSVAGIVRYAELARKYVDPAVLQKNTADVEAQFAQGKFAVTFSGPWLAGQLLAPASQGGYADQATAKAGFGTASFPAGPKGRSVFFGGSNLVIPKASKNEAAAYEFVRWLTADQGQRSYVSKVGMWPTRVSAASGSEFAGNQYLAAFKNQMADGRSYPIIGAWNAIETPLVADMGKVWDVVTTSSGPITAAQVKPLADRAAQDIQAAIAQNK